MGRAILVICLVLHMPVRGETEPNGSRAQANIVTLGSNGQGSTIGQVNPLSDLDFYRVLTPAFTGTKALTITMTPTSSDQGLDAVVQLQDASGNVLSTRDSLGDHGIETIVWQASGNTTYHIVCYSADFLFQGSGHYTLSVGLPIPNLTPFQPSGWSDRIVVSKNTGTTTDSSGLTYVDSLYVDWAVINDGNGATETSFTVQLFVDEVLRQTWTHNPPLERIKLNYSHFV